MTIRFGIAAAGATVLGVGAAVRAMQPGAAATQEPIEVKPEDRPDFTRLLGTAAAIRFTRKEVVSATHVGQGDRLDFTDWRETVEVAGRELAAWRTTLDACALDPGPWPGMDTVLHADVMLPENRRIGCFINLAAETPTRTRFQIGKGLTLATSPALHDSLVAINAELELRHRRARGIALTIAEIAQVPASCARIDCPAMPIARLRQELARFAKVGTLRLRCGSDVDTAKIDDDYITGLAGMSVDGLDLAAGGLTDVGLTRLAALPLTTLVLRGGGAALTAKGFAALAALPLREVTLHACTGLTTAGMTALAKLPHLAVLRLSQSNLGDDGVILKALPSFPALRELAIRSEAFTDAQVPMLLHTKVRALTLVDTKVTAEGLAPLAELPSLQSLHLVGVMIRDDDVDHLAKLTALRQLEIHNGERTWEYFTVEGLKALRAALPNCTINYDPDLRWFDTGRAFPLLID